MPLWIALSLQSVPLAAAPGFDLASAAQLQAPLKLTLLPRCAPSTDTDELVVCARIDARLPKLDPRYDRSLDAEGHYTRRLSDSATLAGGGPKNSVGLTLKLGF